MHPDFPDFETLAAFIDGRLGAHARSKVAAHLTTCTECYTTFVDVSAARQEVGDAAFEPRVSATPAEQKSRGTLIPFPAVAAIAALAAALAAAFFIPAVREAVPGLRSPGIEELAEVAGPERIALARLAGLPYREPPPTYRGGKDGDKAAGLETYELQARAAEIAEAVEKHPTQRNLHALGVAYLMYRQNDTNADDKSQDDLAIESLTKAEKLGAADATLLNDLSAAWLNRGIRKGSKADDLEALADADRAWKLGHEPASAWNRALALESLQRNQEAIAAWQEYLAIEKDPRWHKEAQQRLTKLRNDVQ